MRRFWVHLAVVGIMEISRNSIADRNPLAPNVAPNSSPEQLEDPLDR